MLAVRFNNNGVEEMVELSKGQYEQITDDDIFETLGKRGVSLELRKHINIFQSEAEFVDSMSRSLDEGEAEMYLQDSWDENDGNSSNDAFVVLNARDVSQLLQVPLSNCVTAVCRAATVLAENHESFADKLPTISCSHLLYMIATAIVFEDNYTSNNLENILGAIKSLSVFYYDDPSTLPDQLLEDLVEIVESWNI